MKIGILTHYNVSSHGALLQMYALQEVLKEWGHDVFILTYSRNMDFVDEETRKRFSGSLSNIPYYIKCYMKANGVGCLFYQRKKQRVLADFRNSNFEMLPYTESGKLDCVVVGADEVFSLENGVNIMMFGHGITASKIIAYAPSCGQTDIERIDRFGCRELIREGLNKFCALSARDLGTKKVIDTLIGKNVPVVCDPALLYKFQKQTHKTHKKYIVVYSYQSNFKDKERIDSIKAYAKTTNCALYSVGVYYKWCDRQINCDPLKMISIFAQAEAVITDTFHGTIAAYIAHTPMAVFVREDNNVKLEHLLSIIGIEDRRCSDPQSLLTVLNRDIDFTFVDEKVEQLRKVGIDYLKAALEK